MRIAALAGDRPVTLAVTRPIRKDAAFGLGGFMQRLSGAFFYRLALNIEPLCKVTSADTKSDVYGRCHLAGTCIQHIAGADEMLRLRSTWAPAGELREAVDRAMSDILAAGEAENNEPIGLVDATRLETAAKNFRSALLAEIQTGDFYAVVKKGAYDTTALAEYGDSAFPPSLGAKVPEAVVDAKQAARCIAFDLPTAAAFHMHRANEAVVHAYFKALAPGKTPPAQRSLEFWLKAIEAEPNKDPKIVAALRDLKDLHRNPVSHPEQSLESSEEAIALLGAINTAMTHMLKAMP